MCENKATFIQNIFSLDRTSQTVLKGFVEQVMARTADFDEEDEEVGGEGGRDEGIAVYNSDIAEGGSGQGGAAMDGGGGGEGGGLVAAAAGSTATSISSLSSANMSSLSSVAAMTGAPSGGPSDEELLR